MVVFLMTIPGADNSIKNETKEKHLVKDNKDDWFRLDNAATLFSLVTSSRITCLFRLSVSLKEPINITQLQNALDKIIERFPYYKVELKKGLFWYYWENNPGKPKVILETKYPCQKMPITKRGIFPFRVRAYRNRIAVEFHHSITDGTGALTFLKTLVSEYLRKDDQKYSNEKDILDLNENPHNEEYEDAFKRNYLKDIPNPKSPSRAFQLPYSLEPKGVYHVTTGIISVDEILKKTRELNVTLTEYLIAVYLDALQEILFDLPNKEQKKLMKPIRLQIPVNLRKIYPTKTMRNFSLYVTPSIDPRLGKHTFKEILQQTYHYMRVEVSDKFINQWIARNVRGELNPLLRITPLFLKKMFGKLIYNNLGEYLYSGVLTNLGILNFPDEIKDEIIEAQFVPAPSPVTKVGCAIVSLQDKLYITFGRNISESKVERLFFTRLVKEGIKVRIETN